MIRNLQSLSLRQPSAMGWVLLGLCVPITLSANAGTPLMWAGILHLTLGNLMIGLLEGGLLIYWLGLRQWFFWCALGGMIVANYASSWVGYLILAAVKGLVQSITLLWLKPFFLVCLGVSFLLSLLMEWPVVRWILRCHGKSWKQALRRTFQLHAVSYPLLVAYYFSASGVSLMTDFDLVNTQELIPSRSCTVYYLSIDGASVMRSQIGSEHVPEQVYELEPDARHDRLFIRSDEEALYDLWLLKGGSPKDQEAQILLKDVTNMAVVEDSQKAPYPHIQPQGFPMPRTTGLHFGEVPSLWSKTNSIYRTGFWPVEGLSANADSLRRFQASLETPFLAWSVRNAVEIDEDLLLFQLGPHQICLMHPPTRRLALFALGKGPVVVASR